MPLPSVQQRLDEALAARHAILTGKQKVTIGYGERRLEYAEANIKALDAYIAELRRELSGASAKPVRNRIRYVVPG